jgi:hypothetical protein
MNRDNDHLELARRIALEANAVIQRWPEWKREDSAREDRRFEEMGDTARQQPTSVEQVSAGDR